MANPNPAIYRLALERLRLPGSACVFADDHRVNLPPAEALGITTVLARREADRVAELQAYEPQTTTRTSSPYLLAQSGAARYSVDCSTSTTPRHSD